MSSPEQAIETLETIRSIKQKGDPKEALSLFEEHESSFTIISGANYLKGTLYQDVGNYKEAIKSYKTEIAHNPRSSEAHINMGVIYFKQKMYYEAIA